MKALFIIIGVIVIFGILISSGGVGAGVCVKGVGCVSTQTTGGVQFQQTDGPVPVQAGNP